jgi:isoleucyl-tRNA synthetase
MTVSDEIFKRTADSYRRIRNTARFMLANMNGFNPAEHAVDTKDLLAMDRWIINVAADLQKEIVNAYSDYQFHLVYQKVHNFCVAELGGFYLDIIKDRQYTTQADSLARRSAQTALHHITEALVRWIAPILSFTAEELWQYFPGKTTDSVFLGQWYELPAIPADTFSDDFWTTIQTVKTAVNKVLEDKRTAKELGGSLEAEVTLHCSDDLLTTLNQLGDELRFVLITSQARLKPLSESTNAVKTDVDGLEVFAEKSTHTKCTRCWHHREDVGSHSEHPELCGRCIDNVTGSGEVRHYA